MTPCPDIELLQDYLDGELPAAQAEGVEHHLAQCADCAREVASFRLVFERLEHLPLWDPSPALVERVLAEAMPAHPARWVRAAGWAYAASLAASLGGLLFAAANPVSRGWIGALAGDAATTVVRSFLFVLQSLNEGLLHTLDAIGSRGEWLRSLPALHAVLRPLGQPVVLFTIWAAIVAGAALLWWMRPREGRAVRGDHHVGLLGF